MLKADIVFNPNTKFSQIITCELQEILNVLVFHVEQDKFIILNLEDYEVRKSYLRFKNAFVDVYFENPEVLLEFSEEKLNQLKVNLKYNEDFETRRVCCLEKCLKINEIGIYEKIEKLLDEHKNLLQKLFLSSLIRFSDFMQFVVKNKKKDLVEKMINLKDPKILSYLLEYHKQIYCLFEESQNYEPEPSIDEILELDNLQYEASEEEGSYDFTVSLLGLNDKYFDNNGINKGFVKSLQIQTIWPKADDLEKDILNTDTVYYPLVFHYYGEITKHNFYYLDVDLFFKKYKEFQNTKMIIYLNDGISKLLHKQLEEPKELVYEEQSYESIEYFYCTCRSSFYNKTEFVHYFFIKLQCFLEDLLFPDIAVVNLMASLNYNMRDIYLNTKFLDLLTFQNPIYDLAVVKLLGGIILNLECPKTKMKCRKKLQIYKEKYKNTGLGSTIESFLNAFKQ
ncbi:hypothetical protein NGRA_1643 [Nosema granulosis]|uniref:Uncharacterized protein n=1 Tax=Nosema granulosis TaxID=83296 RepID=A0A9P6KYY7_9MICR|nr:hypothetical protein NGRA_1643 [Nosema granulosis]